MRKDPFPKELLDKLKLIAGEKNVSQDKSDILAYSYDASLAQATPECVIHLDNPDKISPVLKILNEFNTPSVARAAGTNLCGAAINLKGAVILNLAGLNKIRQIDTSKRLAVVEPGVVNIQLQEKLEEFGFFFAPDPASQKVCTIGGNIAQNAGGPQCLKYGVTYDNIEKLEVVFFDGTEKIYSKDDTGPDMISLICQSEGTLAIIKTAWLRILPLPKRIKTISCFFESVENSMEAVCAIIKSGILPRTVEEVDKLSMDAASKNHSIKIPENCEAMLLIELDDEANLESKTLETKNILENLKAKNISITEDKKERELLWKIRKESYPALARIANNIMVEDGCVPRPKLAEAVKKIKEILSSYKLSAGLVFHAGDGNIHPNIVFDQRDKDETRNAKKAGEEILKLCVQLGGTITGEHGVGVEKRKAMNWLYDENTLNLFSSIKTTLDPKNLLNPDKKIPVSIGQIEKINRPETPFSLELLKIAEEAQKRYSQKIPSRITSQKNSSSKENAQPLSCFNLTKITDFDPENMTITAEAGLKLSELKEFLEKNSFDIALPKDKTALGAAIAQKKYLSLENIILGADLILPCGKIARLGGKTIKDASGYQVEKLMIGSMGYLAMIAAVTLKIKKSAAGEEDIKQKPFEKKGENIFKDKIIRQVKNAFDEHNLFNPWLKN